MRIPKTAEAREQITKLIASTRYVTKSGKELPKDKDGMPRVAREPDDPDDE